MKNETCPFEAHVTQFFGLKDVTESSVVNTDFGVLVNLLATLPKPPQESDTKDINGITIRVGDIVGYDYHDSAEADNFEVVFEQNAFRKKQKDWDETSTKPILEFGKEATRMRLIIKKRNT